MSKHRLQLADVQCTPVQFGPDDRVLVRVYAQLDKERHRKLRKGVAKWAGVEEDRVMIVNGLQMEIGIDKGQQVESRRRIVKGRRS